MTAPVRSPRIVPMTALEKTPMAVPVRPRMAAPLTSPVRSPATAMARRSRSACRWCYAFRTLELNSTTLARGFGGGRSGPLQQFVDERRQQARFRFLRLAAAGHDLGELPERLRRAMAGGHFADHLAVIGSGAEYLRLERNRRQRLVFERLGEIGRADLRPLRHPDLIEAVVRAMVVRARCLEQIEQVLGIAQIGEVRRGDHED